MSYKPLQSTRLRQSEDSLIDYIYDNLKVSEGRKIDLNKSLKKGEKIGYIVRFCKSKDLVLSLLIDQAEKDYKLIKAA